MNRHLPYCETTTPPSYREGVTQEQCTICQAWAAGYRVGQHDRLMRDGNATWSPR